MKVVAACDKELVGKVIEKGKFCIEAKSEFYGSEKVSEKKLAGLLKEADSANLLGSRAVNVAIRQGLASDKDIMRIAGIPHVQIFRMR